MKTNKLFLVMAVVMLSALLSGCTVYTSGWSYHQVEPVYVPAPVEVYYSYPSYSAGFEYRSGRIVRHRTWGPTPRQHGPPPSPRHQPPPRQAPPRHRWGDKSVSSPDGNIGAFCFPIHHLFCFCKSNALISAIAKLGAMGLRVRNCGKMVGWKWK